MRAMRPRPRCWWRRLILGAKEVELVRYATSGDITGDRDEVVGYAGLIIR